MVSTRLRCVVSLTIFALLTLCQTAKVVAGAFRAAGPQNRGLDTLPVTNMRRRWPARLLLPLSITSVKKKFKNFSPGKFFSREKASIRAVNLDEKKKKVNLLFLNNKVNEVKAENMLKSAEFKKWRRQAKAAAGRDFEKLMFDTLSREFKDRNNGGIEAIIVQAMKDRETEGLAIRFEGRLLDEWVAGLSKHSIVHIEKYMHYVQKRSPHEKTVHSKMQEKLGEQFMDSRVAHYESAIPAHRQNS